MKYVIFDVGNVIIKGDHNIAFRILEDYGVAPDKARLFFNNPEYADFSRGNITEEEFRQALIEHLDHNLTLEQVKHAHDEHIYGLVDKIRDTLGFAKSKAKIGFLTDTNIWQTAREKEFIDLELYGGPIFRSHELHLMKLDKGLFERVTKEIGDPEGDIILVDDLTNNCLKAKQYGWDFIQFQTTHQTYNELIQKLS